MKHLRRNIVLWTLALAFIITSCKDDDTAPERVLESATFVVSRSASEARLILGGANLGIDLSTLKYDVDVFKITYHTEYKGEDILASALVAIPLKATDAAMVSFQHGTISSYNEAPTAIEAFDQEAVLYAALAAPGFIAVAPDLLGFGSSKSILHPYYVEDLTASAVRDALRGARDFASDKGIGFNGKLFLAGYSQGGYATMATHKSIEAETLNGFDLIASFPAAGGYDVKHMQEYFFGLATYEQPFYLAFVAQAYKTTYGWSEPLSDFFKEPYASRIPGLLDGSKTSSQINAQLTNNIPELVTTDILANISSNAKYKYLIDAFNENSLTDWKPTKPMFMYHGDADSTVPFSNSQQTYSKLVANGASTTTLTLTALPGADHGSGVFPYIRLFLPKLMEMK